MLKLVEKNVQKVQIREIDLKFLCDFYSNEYDMVETVLLVYENDAYYTNISFQEVCSFCEEKDLVYFLRYLCREKSVSDGNNSFKEAEKIFGSNLYIHYVLVNKDLDANSGKAFFYTNLVWDEELYRRNLIEQKEILKEKGIKTYFVKIPRLDEVDFGSRHPEWKFAKFLDGINWSESRQKEMEKYISKFTDLSYEDAKSKRLNRLSNFKNQIGESERTVFLVGPCIVEGWESIESCDTILEILYKKLMLLGLDYKVVKVIVNRNVSSVKNAILEYDIRQNDIILFLDDLFENGWEDFNLSYIYNDYKGDKWLFAEIPIHTTSIANEMIAEELIKNIIEETDKSSEKTYDRNLLHKGEKQLTFEEAIMIENYLNDLRKDTSTGYDIIGACVMNCNPFTKGHYHLIEYASRQVDFLYIFVVEEDAPFSLPFADRIEMVRRGVKDLSNIFVVASGKFIVSRTTFTNYFEKEKYPDAVIDVTRDTMFFKKYIAPVLGISKRFVGEEPIDYITNQYNQSLKRDLQDVVEVIEIPRKKINGEIISAKKVRHYLKDGDWNAIKEIVPQTTFDYLKEYFKQFQQKKNDEKPLTKILEFIHAHDKVIICGLGNDAKNLMWKLDFELTVSDLCKLEFYDRKAESLKFYYRGKSVITFEELVNKYSHYYMLITTHKYKKEIFMSLLENGVNPDHIL